jgi:hypothetical protein
LVTHLQSLSEMTARYRTHQAFADFDEAAFECLRTWYDLQPKLPKLPVDFAAFQEELAIARVWEELVQIKQTPGDVATEAVQRAREALKENFRSLQKANKRKQN